MKTLSKGIVTWLDPVTDEQYNAGNQTTSQWKLQD